MNKVLTLVGLLVMVSFTTPTFAGACFVDGQRISSCQGSDCCIVEGGTYIDTNGNIQKQLGINKQIQGQIGIVKGGNNSVEGLNDNDLSSHSESSVGNVSATTGNNENKNISKRRLRVK